MKRLLRNLLKCHPQTKKMLLRIIQTILPRYSISSHYVEITGHAITNESLRLRTAWQQYGIPSKQRTLVNQQLTAYRQGESVDVFDVIVASIRNLPNCPPTPRLLEIGCSSGYYSEVFAIVGLPVTYTGRDYSSAFIDMARQHYPHLFFDTQDATSLQYGENAFDIVISGCCLLHIPEFKTAIAETARVTSRYAIFHRTPVVLGQENKYYRKLAYGVETVEIHFNEPQFLQLLADNNLELLATYTLNETLTNGLGSATRTYVCQKDID